MKCGGCKTKSSIGKKLVMAGTGLALVGFVIAHLLGNLQIFMGPEHLNKYAAFLAGLGEILWIMRGGLLAVVILHIISAVMLTRENRAARPVGYAYKKNIQTTYAARTMPMSGLIILAFIVYHLLHFTFKVTNPDISHGHDALGRHDVYSMVVLSFQNVFIVLAYIIAQILLCLHLSHGLSSMIQTLGFASDATRDRLVRGARAVAVVIFTAYVSIPVSCYLGIIKLVPGGH